MKFGRSVKTAVKSSNSCHAVIVAAMMALMPVPAMAVGSQCVGLFRGASLAQANIRSLGEIDMKEFSRALKSVDDQALLKVIQDLNLSYQGSGRSKFIKDSLASLAKEFVQMKSEIDNGKARGLTLSADRFALKSAKVVMDEVFRFHNSGMKKSMSAEEQKQTRQHLYTLTMIAEEAMIVGHLHRPGSHHFEIYDKNSITEEEAKSGAPIGALTVIPGDVTVQGSTAMSSTFIIDTQNIPGVASHNAVVSDVVNGKAVVTEALIEDGVNQRLADVDSVQRYFVLSMRDQKQRARVAKAVREFNQEMGIRMAGDGADGYASPIPYDASMSWKAADEGRGVSCTTLVGKLFERAGFKDGRGNPFSRSHGSPVEGVSAELYDLMNVAGNTNGKGVRSVPSPTDPLLATHMILRGYRANYESLMVGRRMRVTMDAFMNTLEANPEVKAQFFAGLEKIPSIPVDKAQVVAMVRKLEELVRVQGLDVSTIAGLRAQVEKSLPQKANLRQIAIFASMNNILEPIVIKELGKLEEANGGYVSLPEMRAAAQGLVNQTLKVTTAILHELPALGH